MQKKSFTMHLKKIMIALDINDHLFIFLKVMFRYLHLREFLDLFEVLMLTNFHWLYTNILPLVLHYFSELIYLKLVYHVLLLILSALNREDI